MQRNITINIPKEVKIWLWIFLFCNLLNAASIVIYKTLWIELYSQLGFVFILSCALYLMIAVVRGAISLFRKKSKL